MGASESRFRKFVDRLAARLEPRQVAARLAGVPRGVVLSAAAYGNDAGFRDQITRWRLPCVVAIRSSTTGVAAG